MMGRIYYNDFDPDAAAWLRELMALGAIPEGDVDERSILDVVPSDLAGYTQCHFFAGIGGWPLALRLAGWPDDRPVWTGSPPCQPFSVAGEGKGRDDERHLAPHFLGLVRACRPPMLFGEQVASSAVFGKAASGARKQAASAPEWAWLDDLSDRLEAACYAVGATDTPSAGIGAPHIRQRAFFGAYDLGLASGGMVNCERVGWQAIQPGSGDRLADGENDEWSRMRSGPDGATGRLADAAPEQHDGAGARGARRGAEHSDRRDAGRLADEPGSGRREEHADDGRRGLGDRAQGRAAGPDAGGATGRMGNTLITGLEGHTGDGDDRDEPGRDGADQAGPVAEAGRAGGVETYDPAFIWPNDNPPADDNRPDRAGPLNGFWRDADWLFCRDGKWRPVEARSLSLADGLPDPLGRGGDPRLVQAWEAAVEEVGFPLGTGMIGRQMRLRGYGNAINPWAAAEFIGAFLDATSYHI